jgi:Phosphodiester glycosidase
VLQYLSHHFDPIEADHQSRRRFLDPNRREIMLRHRPRADRSLFRVRLRRGLVAITMVTLVFAAVILIPALTAPGNDSTGARIAEAARGHGLGWAVTGLERVQYWASPPRQGGHLDAAAQRSLAGAVRTGPAPTGRASNTRTPAASAGVALHARLRSVVSPALPGEGVFVPRVIRHGRPVVQVAKLRPDPRHPSFLAGVAWMSAANVRFQQHPGSIDPGHLTRWSQPATLPPGARSGLAATFNSGFKIADARGAFYQNGTSVGRFRRGAASFVIYTDGHVDIGSWGTEVSMSPTVSSVRQNLRLLIDAGRLTPEINGDPQSTWGATIGAAAYVWRSGVGITASGDIVYVAGDALSARTLAVLLQRAGAVRAMELDINRSWVSYMWYTPARGSGPPAPHKLVDFYRPANRYYQVNSRDFFAVYLK